jgi:two-component system OmpR family response regulator
MRYAGQVMSRGRLIEHVWDMAFDKDSNVVDVYIGYLRAKVDRPFARSTIRTVRGAGYVLADDRAPR